MLTVTDTKILESLFFAGRDLLMTKFLSGLAASFV